MKKYLLLLAYLGGLSYLPYAQTRLKQSPRTTVTTTDELVRKLGAQEVDNSMYLQNFNPIEKAVIDGSAGQLNDFTALREGIRVVKDPTTGLPVYIEGRPKTMLKSGRKANTSVEAKAFDYLSSVKGLLRMENPDQQFELQKIETDELGQSHLRMQQFHKGVPVYGGEIVLHTDRDEVTTLNGKFFPAPTFANTVAKLTPQAAEKVALDELAKTTVIRTMTFGEKKLLQYEKPKTELFVYHHSNQTTHLTYRIEMHPNFLEHWVCFVDAHTGEVLKKYNNLCSLDGPVKATATDLNNVSRSIDAYLYQNRYYLLDASRISPDGKAMFKSTLSKLPDSPIGGIMTIDAQNSSVDSDNLNLAHVTSTNNTWSNKTAVSAHYNAAMAFEYFKTVHKRNSIDGKGGTIISIINMNDDKGAMDNAFWSDKLMVYGNGKTAFKPLAGGLDVAAHEMTHGVIQNSANLEYESQSGAINESFADVFATMVDRRNWTIGEDVVRTSVYSSGALRDLANPNQGGTRDNGYQPKNMNEYYTGTEDNGGVHINSGIPNWAFFKFASATSREKAERVYYRALTLYLTRLSRFIDLRLAVVKAATDLYGASSTEVSAAKAAFDAVGITDTGNNSSTPTTQTLPTNPGEDFLLMYATGDKKLYNAPVNLSKFTPLITAAIAHKPSVTDDGKFAYYVTTNDKFIKAINLQGTVTETVISNEAIWENVAVSKNGEALAAITVNQDKSIWVYSYTKKAWKKFTLYNPTSAQNVQSSQVKYADSFEWDATGEYIIYDAYNELTTAGIAVGANSGTIGYWDVGIIKVWDNAKSDFGPGTINKLISNLEKGESIGNPTFSKNSPNIVAFDYIDPDDNNYIIGANIDKGEIAGIIENNTIGYPEYSKTDVKMVFNTLTSGRDDIGIVDLNADKISPKGSFTTFVKNAKWMVWYGVGTRTLPKKQSQTINVSAITDKTTKDTPFGISATATSQLPVGFSLVSGPAELSGNTVTLTGTTGTVQIVAYQTGNSAFYAAPNITISVRVNPAPVILSVPTNTTQVIAYPNPTMNLLTIKVPSNVVIEDIRMTTTNGMTLLNQTPRSNNAQVDMSQFSQGTYLLHIKTNKGTETQKVIKQN